MRYQFKGTPGPWSIFHSVDGVYGVSGPRPPENGGISDIVSVSQDSARSDEEERANVQLIANAPELLEAAKDALESLSFARQELAAQASIPDADEHQLLDTIRQLRSALSQSTDIEDQ